MKTKKNKNAVAGGYFCRELAGRQRMAGVADSAIKKVTRFAHVLRRLSRFTLRMREISHSLT